MIKIGHFICLISITSAAFSQSSFKKKKSFVTIEFENIANGRKIVYNDSSYTNSFGEKYTISKLKYYISNVHFISAGPNHTGKNVFLIDAAKNNSLKIERPALPIKGIEFWVGVDSILNCTGAQSGALDPLNDMFWTWNTGYVVFKLEGTAAVSTADMHRIEQHIGGYKGEYKTIRKVFIPLKKGFFLNNKSMGNIVISVNLDKYWNGIHKIRISEHPMITTIGKTAKEAADNFKEMFSVKNSN